MKFLVLTLLFAAALAGPSRKVWRRPNNYKIVGGTDAEPGEFPYQLSFQDLSYGDPWHFCGASIYTEEWAITAGHCVYGQDLNNPDYLQVVAGEWDMSVDGNEQTSILQKIIHHEDFNEFYLHNDIALLHLSTPL
ncbi:trypsin-like serine protease, partial [Streptococcus thermophilus]|nr:trypsin-like serine protease [Streptococcus thermophilus]